MTKATQTATTPGETAHGKVTGQPLLEVADVHKWYGRHHVLRGVSLTVERGQVLCVLGPSGSGKSTLLRCMNHLETLDEGLVLLNGDPVGYESTPRGFVERPERDIATTRRRFGFVFQQFELFGHMTNLENVAFGPTRVRRIDKDRAAHRARELLDSMGVGRFADLHPGQLSGGQQQRVAIARAIAMEPELLLFDEPTSALDPELVREVLLVMRRLATEGQTMVVVTHEIGFAREVADTVVFMDEGVVIESGPARAVLDSPRHPRTSQFLARLRSDDESDGMSTAATLPTSHDRS